MRHESQDYKVTRKRGPEFTIEKDGRFSVCFESRDLGYARRQRYEQRQRILTLALLCAFTLGMWGCIHLLETHFQVHTFADFCGFVKALRYIF